MRMMDLHPRAAAAARAALCLIAAAHGARRLVSLAPAVAAMGAADGLTGGLASAALWASRSGDWSALGLAAPVAAANLAAAAIIALASARLLGAGRAAAAALAALCLAALALSASHGALAPLPLISAAAGLLQAAIPGKDGTHGL